MKYDLLTTYQLMRLDERNILAPGAFHDRSNHIFGFFARPFAILMKLGLQGTFRP